MEKTKKAVQPLAVEFDYIHEQIVFSDIAEVMVSEDNVSISFATKSRNGKKALVSHKVYLTIPHFLRLTEVTLEFRDNILNDLNKRAKNFIESENPTS